MATCRYIVNSALRKIGRLGAGREPRVADQADTLAALQGLYGSWVASGAFGRLTDVVPATDYVARENERIIRDPALITVTLPDMVPTYAEPRTYRDERAYSANDARPPRDAAVVQIMDANGGQAETWLYDGTRRAWVTLDALQLDNEAPRSGDDPEGLSAVLALEVADTFGAEVGQATLRQANRFLVNLTHRYSTPRQAAVGVYC